MKRAIPGNYNLYIVPLWEEERSVRVSPHFTLFAGVQALEELIKDPERIWRLLETWLDVDRRVLRRARRYDGYLDLQVRTRARNHTAYSKIINLEELSI